MARSRQTKRIPKNTDSAKWLAVIGLLTVIAGALVVIVFQRSDSEPIVNAETNTPPPTIAETSTPSTDSRSSNLEAIRTAAKYERAPSVLLSLANDARDAGDEELRLEILEKIWLVQPENVDVKRELGVKPLVAEEDLPGFDDIAGTYQSYLAKEFTLQQGTEFSPKQLESLVQRWQQVLPRIKERIALAKTDQYLNRIDFVHSSISSQPFYQDITYEVIEETRPFALFVEVTGSTADREARLRKLKDNYTPFLEEFRRQMEQQLVPLGSNSAAIEAPFIIWILLHEQSYQQFFKKLAGVQKSPGLRAHYNSKTNWLYTHSPDVSSGSELIEGVQSLLHEVVHAYVDRLSTGGIGQVQPHWLNEGLAEYFSCYRRVDRESVYFDPTRSSRIEEYLFLSPELRFPTTDLVKIKSSGDLTRQAANLVKTLEDAAPADFLEIQSGFYAHSYLLCLWLNKFESGRYRTRLNSMITAELSDSDRLDFQTLFPEFAEMPLDQHLYDFARDLYEDRIGSPAPTAKEQSTPAQVSQEQLPTVGPTNFSNLDRDQGSSQYSDRVARWVRFFDNGFEKSDEIFDQDPDATTAQAIQQVIASTFQNLIESQEKVQWSNESKSSPQQLLDGVLILDDDRTTKLRVGELEPKRLRYLVLKTQERTDTVRNVADFLESLDEGRLSNKFSESELARKMREVLESDPAFVSDLLQTLKLSTVLRIESDSEFRTSFKDAWPQTTNNSVIQSRQTAIREIYKRRCLQIFGTLDELGQLFHGDVTVGKDDNERWVQVVYDLSDPIQLSDFEYNSALGALQDLQTLFREDPSNEAPQFIPCKLENGRLTTELLSLAIHKLAFEGDWTCEVHGYLDLANADHDRTLLGIIDPATDSYVVISQLVSLLAKVDGRFVIDDDESTTRTVREGKPLATSLSISQNQAILKWDGAESASCDLPHPVGGRFFLAQFGKSCWSFSSLSFGGTVSESQLRSVAAEWVAAESRQLFGNP